MGATGRDLLARVVGAAAVASVTLAPLPALAQQLPIPAEAGPDATGRYAAQTLTIEGRIGELYQPQVFELETDRAPQGEVLVLASADTVLAANSPDGSTPTGVERARGDLVRVTGSLRVFNRPAIESELNLSLDAGLAALWEGRQVFVATTVEPLFAYSRMASDAQSLLGQAATVRGRVVDILAQQAFVVDTGSGEPVLVVSAPSAEMRPSHWTGAWARDWTVNDQVVITGVLSTLDLPAYEREYGVDLDDNLFGAWQGRPTIYARGVELADRE